MAAEIVYRVTFILLFAFFWVIRIYYVRKTRDPDTPRSRKERREAMRKEGITGFLLIILTYVELVLILLYVWGPMWMSWADLVSAPASWSMGRARVVFVSRCGDTMMIALVGLVRCC